MASKDRCIYIFKFQNILTELFFLVFDNSKYLQDSCISSLTRFSPIFSKIYIDFLEIKSNCIFLQILNSYSYRGKRVGTIRSVEYTTRSNVIRRSWDAANFIPSCFLLRFPSNFTFTPYVTETEIFLGISANI